MIRIINKKQFTLFCLTIVLIVGVLAFWLTQRDEDEKASQPAEQVKTFLHSIQKKTPDFFTDELKNIETIEIQKLKEKNPQIGVTFAQSRTKDINTLKQNINDSIARNWLGFAKSDSDKEKIAQVKFLETIATEAYAKNNQSEKMLSVLSDLKNSNHFRTYYNEEQKTSLEVLPSLKYADQKLTTIETPYQIALPQKNSPELKFNQKDNQGETQLILTLKNAANNNPKAYDNQAIYSEIKKGIDQLLIMQPDGLNNSFILKNPASLQVKDEKGLLTLDYDLNSAKLTATEDQGAIILTDQNNIKQYVITPPTLTDVAKQTPGEIKFNLTKNEAGNHQLQIEVKISKEASFPLLVNFSLLPALTKYL